MEQYIPNLDSAYKVADLMEMRVLRYDRFISKSKILNLLRDNTIKNLEGLVDGAFTELYRRFLLMGNACPFIINGNVIKRNALWQDISGYLMCLIFSLQGVKKIIDDNDGTKLFELLSKEALASYLNGEAIILGFPNARNFPNQILQMAISSNEMPGGRAPLPADKDKGVDIVAWKPHGDSRSNQIILLIQAAAGFHWNLKKPISLRAWNEFMFWAAPPTRGIIVPIVIPNEKWTTYRDDYDLLFDRIRIQKALFGKQFSMTNLRADIIAWCEKELN